MTTRLYRSIEPVQKLDTTATTAIMKITLLIAAGLSLAGYSMAAPTEGSELVKSADLPAVDLTFQGPAFPDGPNVTLTGTAKDVYEQLLAINPEYDAWQMPGYAEKMAQLGVTKDDLEALKARQTVVRVSFPRRNCKFNLKQKGMAD